MKIERECKIRVPDHAAVVEALERLDATNEGRHYERNWVFDTRDNDLYGREVATGVDRVMPPGEHVVEFDASGLPAGVYLWRQSAVGGQRSAVGKMVKF